MDMTIIYVICLGIAAAFGFVSLMSAMGGEADVVEGAEALDADLDMDVDVDVDFDVESDLATDAHTRPEALIEQKTTGRKIAELLGLRGVSLSFWIFAFTFMTGVTGLLLKNMAFGGLLVAVPVGLITARIFGKIYAGMTKTYTSVTSIEKMRHIPGVVQMGDARRGRAAKVNVTDRRGNIHTLYLEPLYDDEVIPKGTPVTAVRVVLDRDKMKFGHRIIKRHL